ncbi:hypothetical protein MUG78_16740 [Gordonia alkaliphila]|uniref:hypothetical protein n=1 Tax=Gordonia alkaliphila TaxID=1053547 RepID=UPI001FF65B7F|nr:hypothetical protein [Gordonia alkaliphila]MCK0441049.1 hypothetical protein [Gordonia alkaliphila]
MAPSELYHAVAVYPAHPDVNLAGVAREIESQPAELALDVLDYAENEQAIRVSRGLPFSSTPDATDLHALWEDTRRAMPSTAQSPGPVPMSVTRIRDQVVIEFPTAWVDEAVERLS